MGRTPIQAGATTEREGITAWPYATRACGDWQPPGRGNRTTKSKVLFSIRGVSLPWEEENLLRSGCKKPLERLVRRAARSDRFEIYYSIQL